MQTVRILPIRGLEDSTYNVSAAQKVLRLNLRPAIDVMKASTNMNSTVYMLAKLAGAS